MLALAEQWQTSDKINGTNGRKYTCITYTYMYVHEKNRCQSHRQCVFAQWRKLWRATGLSGFESIWMVNMDGNVKEMTGTPCTYNIHFHPPSIAKPIHANAQMTNVWRENKRMGNSKKMKSYNLIGFRFSSVFCDLIVHKQCVPASARTYSVRIFSR